MDTTPRLAATGVFGLGSPHGDDQAGWLVIDVLQRMHCGNAFALGDPMQLLEKFPGCNRAILIDAAFHSHSKHRVGQVCEFTWPDERLVTLHTSSTHGFNLGQVLELASQLGSLPAEVTIYTINAGPSSANNSRPLQPVSHDVRQAAEELALRIGRQLGEVPVETSSPRLQT